MKICVECKHHLLDRKLKAMDQYTIDDHRCKVGKSTKCPIEGKTSYAACVTLNRERDCKRFKREGKNEERS